jgi:hypothetical protein
LIDQFGLWGTLVIRSYSGDGGSTSGHSWIEYYHENSSSRVTFGTYGNNNGAQGVKGLNRNSELAYPSSASRSAYLNDHQEMLLMDYIIKVKASGEDGWSYLSPCSDFASDAWKAVTGEQLQDRNIIGISNPTRLAESINNAGDVNNFQMTPSGDIESYYSFKNSTDPNTIELIGPKH